MFVNPIFSISQTVPHHRNGSMKRSGRPLQFNWVLLWTGGGVTTSGQWSTTCFHSARPSHVFDLKTGCLLENDFDDKAQVLGENRTVCNPNTELIGWENERNDITVRSAAIGTAPVGAALVPDVTHRSPHWYRTHEDPLNTSSPARFFQTKSAFPGAHSCAWWQPSWANVT